MLDAKFGWNKYIGFREYDAYLFLIILCLAPLGKVWTYLNFLYPWMLIPTGTSVKIDLVVLEKKYFFSIRSHHFRVYANWKVLATPFPWSPIKIWLIIRRGFKERRTERTPTPTPKIFKDSGFRGYVYIHIMTNVHILRSILKSQLFTCLSLAILYLSCRLCSVALIFRSG